MVNEEMVNQPIYIADYNYPLPDERIAKYPLPERDHSKLLVYRDGQVSEDRFYNGRGRKCAASTLPIITAG